jgi:alkylated DNA repair dioxygenase AlkB
MNQLSMFGGGELALDASFAAAERRDLDATSWVEFVPGWISGNEKLMESVVAGSPFDQRKRWMFTRFVDEPRLTGECCDIAAHCEPFLAEIAQALSTRYGVTYDSIWMNLYRDERDGTSWHGDPSLQRGTAIVPVLSLGATRRFLLRPRAGGRSVVMAPTGGDLVVMGGRCQLDWQHCVPKQFRASGMRVSLNFQSSWQMQGPGH